uniref:J domain-containing protein n=1 Tax=Trichuris muris TaxID=70415 RepID=A0A5S6QEN1_TRIMR
MLILMESRSSTMEGGDAEVDYYTFMNIRKDATTEEIGQAFRRLSLIYHPDRHTDPVLRARSQELFDKVRKIYEVLMDPHRREIYDAVGEKGLELTGWEVVERGRTREEIVAEFVRIQRLYEMDQMHESTNPKGSFTLHASLSQLFDKNMANVFDGVFNLNGMTLVQSVQIPVNSAHCFVLAGKLQAYNGVGDGLLSLKLRSKLNAKTHSEVMLNFNGGMVLGVKLSRILLDLFVVSVTVSTPTRALVPSCDLSIDFSRPLSAKCIGHISVKFGTQCSVTTSLNFSTLKKNSFMIGCLVGLPTSMLMASYVHHFGCSGSNLQTSVKVGTMGVIADYSYEGQITQFSSLQYMFQIYYPLGIFSRVRLKRGKQVYETNISLAEHDFPVKAVLAGLLVSVFCRGMFNYCLKPLFYKIKDYITEEIDHPESTYNRQKREYELNVAVMSQEAKRLQTMEAQRYGLVITTALYGTFDSNLTPDKVIDVTYPVQLLVRDSKLIIFGGQSKSALNGFFDPHPGRRKKLKIDYTFRGIPHQYVFDDEDPVVMPKRAHLSTLASQRNRS